MSISGKMQLKLVAGTVIKKVRDVPSDVKSLKQLIQVQMK